MSSARKTDPWQWPPSRRPRSDLGVRSAFVAGTDRRTQPRADLAPGADEAGVGFSAVTIGAGIAPARDFLWEGRRLRWTALTTMSWS
jgi:hypothetical protein